MMTPSVSRPPHTKDRRAWTAGFTLVELMVALALAAIISVSIMFISSQARLAYDETVKKVDVYNRFRYALHILEQDLQNWVPTSDLEFYTDGRGKGARLNNHWDPGEEVPDRKDDLGPGVVDGGVVGEFDEFATVSQRQYLSREPFQPEEKLHDAYQIYFRTFTYVNGEMRLANIEYMLLDPSKVQGSIPQPPDRVETDNVKNLALYKIIRYFKISHDVILQPNVTPVERKVVEVCSNVTDFKIEYLVDKDRRARLNAAPRPENALSVDFRTPEEDFKAPVETAMRPRYDKNMGPTGAYRKVFGYGSIKLSEKIPQGVAYPARRGDDNLIGGADHRPVRFGFQGSQEIAFTELTPGDKIFIFTQSSRGEQAQGAGAAAGTNVSKLNQFPSRDYTVKTNSDGLLEFEENIDSTQWNNENKTNLYYKASFLPGAVRVTLRVVDDTGQNPKTLQREVWLRRRSR